MLSPTRLLVVSVSFWPEVRTGGIEHVSVRRLASTQSNRIRTAFAASIFFKNFLPCLNNHFKRKEKRSQPVATRSSQSHGCKKRSIETRQIHLYNGPMAERRSVPRVLGTKQARMQATIRFLHRPRRPFATNTGAVTKYDPLNTMQLVIDLPPFQFIKAISI